MVLAPVHAWHMCECGDPKMGVRHLQRNGEKVLVMGTARWVRSRAPHGAAASLKKMDSGPFLFLSSPRLHVGLVMAVLNHCPQHWT